MWMAAGEQQRFMMEDQQRFLMEDQRRFLMVEGAPASQQRPASGRPSSAQHARLATTPSVSSAPPSTAQLAGHSAFSVDSCFPRLGQAAAAGATAQGLLQHALASQADSQPGPSFQPLGRLASRGHLDLLAAAASPQHSAAALAAYLQPSVPMERAQGMRAANAGSLAAPPAPNRPPGRLPANHSADQLGQPGPAYAGWSAEICPSALSCPVEVGGWVDVLREVQCVIWRVAVLRVCVFSAGADCAVPCLRGERHVGES